MIFIETVQWNRSSARAYKTVIEQIGIWINPNGVHNREAPLYTLPPSQS